jgi:hypothetical protein
VKKLLILVIISLYSLLYLSAFKDSIRRSFVKSKRNDGGLTLR